MIKLEGYEGYYQVSNKGRVKSLTRTVTQLNRGGLTPTRYRGHILKLVNRSHKYKATTLCRDGKGVMYSVHRLVVGAFIENPENKPEVNHKNGNKSDNRVENLEWCTPSENEKHAYRTGLKSHKGENHNRSKLKQKDVDEIRGLIGKVRGREIAKRYGVSEQLISSIKNGWCWL